MLYLAIYSIFNIIITIYFESIYGTDINSFIFINNSQDSYFFAIIIVRYASKQYWPYKAMTIKKYLFLMI